MYVGLWCRFKTLGLLQKEFDSFVSAFPVSWRFILHTPNVHVTGVKWIAKVIWVKIYLI